jgi:hypothetical protein
VPVVPQVLASVTAHFSCGSGALSATAMHKPGAAGRLQDMHAPAHAFSQQTPWAQKPDLHSVPTLQFAPLGLKPQDAFRQ